MDKARLRFATLMMVALGAWSFCSASIQPQVLIVQPKSPTTPGNEMDLSMADYIAQEFLIEGRVKPVVYGITDQTFREAIESGQLKKPSKWPTQREALEVAAKLGAQYVFFFYPNSIKGGQEKAKAEIFDRGKKIWTDSTALGIRQGDDINPTLTSQSIARTWVLHSETDKGPFRSLVVTRALETPVDHAGQAPVPPVVVPTKIDDDSEIKRRVEKLLLDHQTDRAIVLLRDAVDLKPFDAERRIMLVQTLLDANHNAEAGEEADRAVMIAPEHTELRALAAKAWMAAGKNDQARLALNEALARDKDSVKMRLMLAEISLARLEPDKALENLDAALKEKPSRAAYYLRSLSRALLGGEDGVVADMGLAGKLAEVEPESEIQRRYELSATALDDALKGAGEECRVFIQRAIVRPDDSSLHDKVAESLRLTKARIAFLTAIPVPTSYHPSNERRLLAHRNLVQALLALQSFFTGGGEDAMTDARIDLGEALKQASDARSAFQEERKSGGGI